MHKTRNNAILIGLFLSRFDEDGLNALGFSGFWEAFNTLGYAIGVKPSSIKNYRDEFDPYYPNTRKGWHKRSLRDYCKVVMEEYARYDLHSFTEIVKELLINNYEVERIEEMIIDKKSTSSIAQRLITGQSAEAYFKENYLTVPQFQNYAFKDTTLLGCGFDFLLTRQTDFFCVEVKGLHSKSGTISLTEKEYQTAEKLSERFCLYVVSNFCEQPIANVIINPLESGLDFVKDERLITVVSFQTYIR
ncbi:MAG TPA: DUF3883 domain-containing protein [Saprospiraceae bacterium]|nr:DUF3883 domain-containing protein [Saprospiraceae bacterium]